MVLRKQLMKHNRLQIKGGLRAALSSQMMSLKTWGAGASTLETCERLKLAREEGESLNTNQC